MTPTQRPELPPARLSTDDDEFIRIRCVYGSISVLLDGHVVKHCTSYDVEARTVERAKLDDGGRFIIEDGRIVLETLTGEVEPRWCEVEVMHG